MAGIRQLGGLHMAHIAVESGMEGGCLYVRLMNAHPPTVDVGGSRRIGGRRRIAAIAMTSVAGQIAGHLNDAIGVFADVDDFAHSIDGIGMAGGTPTETRTGMRIPFHGFLGREAVAAATHHRLFGCPRRIEGPCPIETVAIDIAATERFRIPGGVEVRLGVAQIAFGQVAENHFGWQCIDMPFTGPAVGFDMAHAAIVGLMQQGIDHMGLMHANAALADRALARGIIGRCSVEVTTMAAVAAQLSRDFYLTVDMQLRRDDLAVFVDDFCMALCALSRLRMGHRGRRTVAAIAFFLATIDQRPFRLAEFPLVAVSLMAVDGASCAIPIRLC